LPQAIELPDFSPFVENGLGVAAFVDEKMIGYLCCYSPFEKAFGTTNAIGVWSPIHGNGMIDCEYKNVFARMYQEAAIKWVNLKATSHAITFYAHNNVIESQLYRYGFGLRCIDSIREIKEIEINDNPKYYISELEHSEFHLIFPIGLLLDEHMSKSPIFMRFVRDKTEDGHEYKFAEWQIREKYRYFAAKDGEKIIAYIKIHDEGENFIGDVNNMKHIHGAYCFPEYRGRGIIQNILNFIIKKLRDENNQLLGVDFESFNPTANNFWLKYFTEYTHSAVRRIDDLFI
ncbi:MAG: GNAT family N-acetyltransferase, partial [Treponema sp.]|nr:GNAT family N-acetyltransferase [Treponema sp.]